MGVHPLVDTHVHFHDRTNTELVYPQFGVGFQHPTLRLGAVASDVFDVAAYRAETRSVPVAGMVHVAAALGSENPVAETRWADTMASASVGTPLALVAGCDLSAREAAATLDRHLEASERVRGVRDHRAPTTFDDAAWLRGFREVAERDLLLEVYIGWERLAPLRKLADSRPEVTIVVEHAAAPTEREPDSFADWRHAIHEAAGASNVICKISGLGMGDPEWTIGSLRPWVLECLEAFGPDRCMLGSHWPYDRLFSGFDPLVAAWREILTVLPEDEQAAVFHRTAQRVYGLAAEGGEPEERVASGRGGIARAVASLAEGRCVVVADGDGDTYSGDLVLAAEHASAETVAFLTHHTTGVIWVALSAERLRELRLPVLAMPGGPAEPAPFTISVDAHRYGASAADRAVTARALADPATRPDDLHRPGHVFPLQYCRGGVLERAGHTEAGADLVRLAGLYPAAVIARIVNRDGSLAGPTDVDAFAARHGFDVVSVDEVVEHRWRHESLMQPFASCRLPTPSGQFVAHAVRSVIDGAEHVAFVMGDPAAGPMPVAAHAECLLGDVFGSRGCTCRERLDGSLQRIGAHGRGTVVYLRGRPCGATVSADDRLVEQILQTVAVTGAVPLPDSN